MKTKQTSTSTELASNLSRVTKSFYLQLLVQTCWNVACTTLWNSVSLSSAEKQNALRIIQDHLSQANDSYRQAVVFCQRVLLAKEYIGLRNGRYIPLPSVWFDPLNEKGYAGTEKWFDNLLKVRSSLPLYKITYKAFAEAVLEMAEDPCPANFRYWKNYFMEKKTPVLFQLFIATIANARYE